MKCKNRIEIELKFNFKFEKSLALHIQRPYWVLSYERAVAFALNSGGIIVIRWSHDVGVFCSFTSFL